MHNRRGARTFAGLAVCAVGAAVLLLGNTARRRLGDASVDEVTVVIAGLANSYSDYVTTYEEYQAQRYDRRRPHLVQRSPEN